MIFCVEDDRNIRELVVYTLSSTGMEAEGFEDGEVFFKALAERLPELILLDIMLPGEDGLTILKKLKGNKKTKDIPVIMVTAKGTEYDKVSGLDAGADDYVTKPFGMMELVSRIKAVLRRTKKKEEAEVLKAGPITLNEEKARKCPETETCPSDSESTEMQRLIHNKGIVLTRDQLLEEIWGYDFDGETRTVDVHIRTLRQKLGSAGEVIETVRGVGYRITEDQEEA